MVSASAALRPLSIVDRLVERSYTGQNADESSTLAPDTLQPWPPLLPPLCSAAGLHPTQPALRTGDVATRRIQQSL